MYKPTSKVQRATILFCRSCACVVATGALVIYVILLSKYNTREDTTSDTTGQALYKYLPIGALSLSLVWNVFSLITLGLRAAIWLSNRFRNAIDVFAAIELAALGYVSFVYSLVNEWHGNNIAGEEKVLQVVALTLLSLTGAAHLLFFCYDCATDFLSKPLRTDEPDSWLGQPPYSGDLGQPKSTTHLSEYSGFSSLHRNSHMETTNPTRSVEAEVLVKPLPVHRASRSATLKKKSIRPVRPSQSIDIPSYTPNGFITRIEDGSTEIMEPYRPVSPIVPPSPILPSLPSTHSAFTNRDRRSLSTLPASNTLPTDHYSTLSRGQTTHYSMKIPSRTHTRSFSSVPYESGSAVQLSRSRSLTSPSPSGRMETGSYYGTPMSTIPLKLRQMPPPPIEEHPAYQGTTALPAPQETVTPPQERFEGVPSTNWGGNPYSDSRNFIPAHREVGGAFGDHTPLVISSKPKKFVFP